MCCWLICRRRKIDVLVVWALDRLAKSLKQLLTIAEGRRSLGVDLVSLKQNVNTTLAAGRLTSGPGFRHLKFELGSEID